MALMVVFEGEERSADADGSCGAGGASGLALFGGRSASGGVGRVAWEVNGLPVQGMGRIRAQLDDQSPRCPLLKREAGIG